MYAHQWLAGADDSLPKNIQLSARLACENCGSRSYVTYPENDKFWFDCCVCKRMREISEQQHETHMNG